MLTVSQNVVTFPPNFVQILFHVGPSSLVDWLRHFAALGLYTALHEAVGSRILKATDGEASGQSLASSGSIEDWATNLAPSERFTWRRRAEAWKFGAGLDYEL